MKRYETGTSKDVTELLLCPSSTAGTVAARGSDPFSSKACSSLPTGDHRLPGPAAPHSVTGEREAVRTLIRHRRTSNVKCRWGSQRGSHCTRPYGKTASLKKLKLNHFRRDNSVFLHFSLYVLKLFTLNDNTNDYDFYQ